MKEINCIVFDLDGTLVDSQEDIVFAVNFTLRELNLREKPFDEVVSFIGTGVNGLIKKALGEENKSLFDKGLEIFNDYYKKHCLDKTMLYPHIKETLECFRKKLLLVVTNRTKKMAVLTLCGLDIYKYFKDVIGGDNEACLKPAGCSLDKVFEYETGKEKILLVGDMDLDVLAGKAAGISTCAVTYGIGKKEDILKSRPDFIIDDILGLKNIIR